MAEREQINIKIRPSKKERWIEYQEENSQYGSMTDLIRQSVEKEIAGDEVDGTIPDNMGSNMAEIKDKLSGIEGDIDMLSSVISDLQQTVKSDPSDKHLRSEIFASLPKRELGESPKSPEDIAKELGPVDEQVVREVLDDLYKEVSVVTRGQKHEHPDSWFYSKTE